MVDPLKGLHDQLLSLKPDGVEHNTESDPCPYCSPNYSSLNPEGGDMSSTFTETELNTAVREALAKIEGELAATVAELNTYKTSEANDEVEAKITAAKAEADEAITALQVDLDGATLRADAAEAERDGIVSYLKSLADAAEAETEAASLKTTRIDAVKEVASFKDEYIESRADAWVAMDEAGFEIYLEGLREVASANGSPTTFTNKLDVPADTAMQGVRGKTKKDSESLNLEVLAMQAAGYDFRTIH